MKKSLATPTVGAESRTNFRRRRMLGHHLPSCMCVTGYSNDRTRWQGGLQVSLLGAVVGPKKIDQGNVANAEGKGPNPPHSHGFEILETILSESIGKSRNVNPVLLVKIQTNARSRFLPFVRKVTFCVGLGCRVRPPHPKMVRHP